ncbi:lipopolysaccharide-induced tumor necrosis factor-alpha factor homolog [Glandiceps talaboti]
MSENPQQPDGKESLKRSDDIPPPYYGDAQVDVVCAVQPPLAQITSSVSTFGEAPVRMECTNCRDEVLTRTEYKPGAFAWMSCGVITLFW